MGILGFNTENNEGGGEFTAIVKYDARSGRIFRVDRIDDGNGFVNTMIDITEAFKAVADLDNIEVGWIMFAASTAPSFALVKYGQPYPPRPSPQHKQGGRFMLKLAKSCGGDKPVREIAGNSKSFLSGLEALYAAYAADKGKYPNKLPVISMKTSPVVSGSGATKSTNYRPTFRITDWAPRPADLVANPTPAYSNGSGQVAAPATGATTPLPPNNLASQQNLADDFG